MERGGDMGGVNLGILVRNLGGGHSLEFLAEIREGQCNRNVPPYDPLVTP